MAKVFISYRRTDSAAMTGRIYDRLVLTFGRENIFKDVDDIPPGVRFPEYIQDSLKQCTVELVIIGREWLTARTEDGRRRLDDPQDWVRLEIEQGLALGLTVIPLLVEGASMPTMASLPESLRELREINAVEVRNDPDFGHDMDRLLAALEHVFAAQPKHSGPNWFHRSQQATPQVAQPLPEKAPSPAEVQPSLRGWPRVAPEQPKELASEAESEREPSLSPPSGGGVKMTGEQTVPWGGSFRRADRRLTGTIAILLVVVLLGGLLATHVPGSPFASTGTPTATVASTPASHSPWKVITSPTTNTLYGVDMVSASDGWAVGLSGTILHYTNSQWTPALSPPTSSDLTSVAMDSATDGWAVGDALTILHYTGGQWAQVTAPIDFDLISVAMDSATDGWAVGDEPDFANGTILHYTGGQWVQVTVPTSNNLISVAMISASDGWAVGSNGTILHYTGGQWKEVTSQTSNVLSSVAIVSANESWAVGEHGMILHYTGGQWTQMKSPTINNLISVAMVSTTDGWAVGDSGTMLHYTGGQWQEVLSPTPNSLWSVAMVSATNGWAVGAHGTILHYSPGM